VCYYIQKCYLIDTGTPFLWPALCFRSNFYEYDSIFLFCAWIHRDGKHREICADLNTPLFSEGYKQFNTDRKVRKTNGRSLSEPLIRNALWLRFSKICKRPLNTIFIVIQNLFLPPRPSSWLFPDSNITDFSLGRNVSIFEDLLENFEWLGSFCRIRLYRLIQQSLAEAWR
jgi:hypothetical protein